MGGEENREVPLAQSCPIYTYTPIDVDRKDKWWYKQQPNKRGAPTYFALYICCNLTASMERSGTVGMKAGGGYLQLPCNVGAEFNDCRAAVSRVTPLRK